MLDRMEASALRRLLSLPTVVRRGIGGRTVAGEPIDPTVAMLVRVQRWRGTAGLSAGTPDRTRRRVRRVTALLAGPPTPVGAVRPVTVAGRLRGRLYEPGGGGEPLLVYFHGGGFVAGDLDSHDEMCRLLCVSGRVRVLSVAYRLAPEAPFPAAVEDAHVAVTWAFTRAPVVAAGGDSAGANLAAVVCQLLRGERAPAAQLLLYPLLDHAGSWPSRSRFAGGPVLTARDLDFFRRHYLPDGVPDDVRHSPLRAPDLTGLPPAVVVTAALDPLRDEGEAYAGALRAAGVPVRSWRVPGLVHAFGNMTSVSAAARDATVEAGARLAAVLRA